jgi:predicted DNA-binding mobile mystery protein A
MQPDKTILRRRLDERLATLDGAIGPRPPSGWLREIRLALSMSTVELGKRMDISQPRASRLERAEVEGTIRLSTLSRAAEALNCTLHYVLGPDEPLEDMVLRQADRKATLEQERFEANLRVGSDARFEEEVAEFLEVRTLELVDSRGLWL